uniref:mRNA export factor GLE1 n=1 Tax=Ditylum brightwellii TaxID=49249 RepID=A0A6V2HMQ0_9STRA
MEYVTKAHKLCEQLKQVRATLEPFEKNKAISKRRLNMKKIVKGKLNTLSHEGNKILSVVSEIANAVEVARGEDEGVKKQLKEGGGVGMDGGGALTSDMARGKRYLVDLLASNVIVRVQAESFNGTRGDGFPLAAMLAKLSIETKDIVPILTAHLYTACPVAIPTLPTGGQDGVGESSEEDLMESLGMQKDKNGEYESFDRFLGRTEGLVSIVADIMSSYPENHSLLGGHKGAVIYLERFLAFLPPAPHQVPLLTAPVLVAFLTGAGHMLANKFPDKFRPILDTITNDVMLRLDEGTTGVPSATRLRKLTEDGFDGFKNKLPPGAIPELYDGAEGTGSGVPPAPVAPVGSSMPPMSAGEESNSFTAQTTPFGALPVTQQESQWSQNNAFGGTTNPFGQTENNSMTETAIVPSSGGANPFGSQHQQTTPFGGLTNTPSQGFNSSTPFGGGGSTAPVPFGGTSNPFEAAGGVGGGTNVQPSPFGGGGGGNNSQDNRPPCRFFAQGTCRNGANCTFSHGSTNNAQPNNAFGGGGGGNSNNGTDKKQPCRFFAQGKCRNGANCKFSHETAGGSGGATQSTGAFGASTPFGGGGNNNSQPGSFGGNTQSTPFGGGTPSTPFGGNNAGAQNNPFGGGAQNTPFGGGTQKATPFGGIGANAPTTPFGGGGSNTQTTPFGGGATNTQTTPFGGGAGNTQTTPFGGGGGINAQTTPFGGGGVTNTQTTPFGGGGGGFGSFGGGGINTTAKWAPQR